MRLRVKQWMTLTGLTALEAIRQPVCLLLTVTCVVGISLMPVLITHKLGEGVKLVRDSALAFHLVSGLLLGSYLSCSSLTRELRSGTAAAILSKPVRRGIFFLAKYFGVALVMLGFSICAGGATLLAARTAAVNFRPDWWGVGPLFAAVPLALILAGINNYFTRRPFASTAYILLLVCVGAALAVSSFVGPTEAGSVIPWNIVPASILVTMAILVLTSITVTLATHFNVMSTLAIASVILMLGMMSDYLFGRFAGKRVWAAVGYGLIPNWQHFWAADALTAHGGIPWDYIGAACVYAGLYLAGVLCIGMVMFNRLEIKT